MTAPLFPVAERVNDLVSRFQQEGSPLLDGFSEGLTRICETVQLALTATPPWAVVAVFALLGFWRRGWKLGCFAGLALGLVFGMGFGEQLLQTLAQILTATTITLCLGIPFGIFLGSRPLAAGLARPLLDFMQTMPAFVYLIPAAMLFGLGLAPALLATVIFSLPPVVRLTSMGIRQVDRDVQEAASTLGATSSQILFQVRLPYALPSIMEGISQSIMMALSMVIIASMVGAGGLGNEVLSAIQRLDIGQGFTSGLCVVLLAMVIDRIAESFIPRRDAGR